MKTLRTEQCHGTVPLSKGGVVFCVEREGHDGEHRGNRKRWSDRLWMIELGGARVLVRANTREDARKAAATACGNEGSDPWLDPLRSNCKEILALGKSGIIMLEREST